MLAIVACSKSFSEPFIAFQNPAGFPEPAYNFSANTITKEGFELGRKLFYDPILSRNNMISCGSCHLQTSAFTHHGHDVSHGIDDRLGIRNSPPIMNLAWSTSFMWDGGVVDLDLQPIVPITSHVEMDEDMGKVIEKLNTHATYPALFKSAFGNSKITTAAFLKGLSQFMLLCNSTNSKYDSVKSNSGVTFSKDEQEGYAIFINKCNACHKEPLFTVHSFRNNGIGKGIIDDKGRYDITLNEADSYKFKVPSLRNLGYTAPFMHDGRFRTLEQTLDHYTDHVQISPTLDPILQNGTTGIPLNTEEKRKLITFLNTLNDRDFILNRNLSEQ